MQDLPDLACCYRQAVRQIQGSICLDSLARFIGSIEPAGDTDIKQWGMQDLEDFFQVSSKLCKSSLPGALSLCSVPGTARCVAFYIPLGTGRPSHSQILLYISLHSASTLAVLANLIVHRPVSGTEIALNSKACPLGLFSRLCLSYQAVVFDWLETGHWHHSPCLLYPIFLNQLWPIRCCSIMSSQHPADTLTGIPLENLKFTGWNA